MNRGPSPFRAACLLPGWLSVLIIACQPSGQENSNVAENAGSAGLCEVPATPISNIQGSGFSSPLAGQSIAVRGVVTLTQRGKGLYLQEARPAETGRISQGIYVASADPAAEASEGEVLTVIGTVRELGEGDNTLTSITEIDGFEICGTGPEPPIFEVLLPLNAGEREAYEAMQIRIEQPVTVTEVRDVRDGEISVSVPGILRAPTEIVQPGAGAVALAQENQDRSMPVRNDALRDLDPYTLIQAGAVINVLDGVMGHDGSELGFIVKGDLAFEPQPPPVVPQAAAGNLRLASFNLHEYFNGDGRGGGFPGERGAETEAEFRRQSKRIVSAVAEIKPDLLAYMELENDGFGADSAGVEFASAVSHALGVPYQLATPESDRVGTDVISVGLVFRPDRLIAHGPARLLEGGSFGPLNRVPMAQMFSDRQGGEKFLVVVNHLKSKGYCPESGPNLDQGDGQACWNPTRVEGAIETVRWARAMAAEGGTSNLLLLGDFNAYRLEDPVVAVLGEGLIELVERHQPKIPLYSYIYRGAAGTLDYAFASDELAALSQSAFIWHINAAYPWSGRPSEPWLRCSDHDPVVVDFSMSQDVTSD